jgi:hypothetical protein
MLPDLSFSNYRYFHKFEAAEKRYLNMQREDLAKQLRYKLGDWFRVIKLMNARGSNADVKGAPKFFHFWGVSCPFT